MNKPSFFNRLETRAHTTGSLLCIGLDPHPEDLPKPDAASARDFCLNLIRATSALALAYKPNAAFFEAYGPDGWSVLKELISSVPDEIPVILDAKRGDIASTAEAYARSSFGELGADAITLSPYLGQDSLEPFLKDPTRGVFLLCKTSNPGAGDLQDLPLGGSYSGMVLYEQVALKAQEWNKRDNLGLVVGATQPAALQQVRNLAPQTWILAPGIGAQGGEIKEALRAGLRRDGLGLILPISRTISRAADPHQAALHLLRQIQAEQNVVKNSAAPSILPPEIAALADGLLSSGCVRFGSFTLKSGQQSPIYLDLRNLVSHPVKLAEIGRAYQALLANLSFDRLAAIPYAALPIATTISLLSGKPMLYPRKETKAYGTQAEIEGEYQPGERVVVIDDLATTGASKFEILEKITQAGLEVRDVVVLIDREGGARQALAQKGIQLHAVCTLTDLLNHWEQTGQVPANHLAAARRFLEEKQ